MITIELDGTTEAVLAEPVLAAVAVRAACSVPGVRRTEPGLGGLLAAAVRRGRRTGGPDPAPTDGVRVRVVDGQVRVSAAVSVVVTAGQAVVPIGQAVQRAVAAALAEETGHGDVSVDVSVVDIEVGR